MIKTICAVMISAVSFYAYSQAIPATSTVPVAWSLASSGNVSTVGNVMATSSNASSFAFAPAANGGIYANASASIPVSASRSVPAAVVGRIGISSAAAAIGRFLGRVVGPLAVGVALYDLSKELGFNLSRSSDGAMTVGKVDPSVCTVAPCTGWKGRQPFGSYVQPERQAAIDVCSYYYGPPTGIYPIFKTQIWDSWGGPGWLCASNISETVSQGTVAPASETLIPSTAQELIDAIAAKSAWPQSSAIARAISDAIKSGESVQVVPESVTGPASSTGRTSITTNPDGSTSTSTTNYTHNYAGPTVTTTSTTNVVNNNPVTNTTTITTTTTAPETPNPPKSQCELTPHAIGCAEFGIPDSSAKLTPTTQAVALNPVAFAGSITCPPSMPINFAIMGRQFSQSISYAPLCSAANDYVKPVLLLLALAASAWIFVGGLKS